MHLVVPYLYLYLYLYPLIRKIESNPVIKPIPIPQSRFTGIKIKGKVGGFADDIGVAINNDTASIKGIFEVYKLFSKLSGIELNLSKTEILKLNVDSVHRGFVPEDIELENNIVSTKESVTICGICFSNNKNIEYQKNILDKIQKMERQLIIWLQRGLSVEGRSLIVKTFGMSQLIYSLQMCNIEANELVEIERMIFKFLWNKKWVGNRTPDRIKREVLKLTYERGGLQVPDVHNMSKALKIKQFIRAMHANHSIQLVQKYQLERRGYDEYYKCEYAKICTSDPIIEIYQKACNLVTDKIRERYSLMPLPDVSGELDAINIIASTDIVEFLMRKQQLLILNRFGRLAALGINSLKELINESNFPRDDGIGDLASYILNFIPRSWILVVSEAIDVNPEINYEFEFPSCNGNLTPHSKLSVKKIREGLQEGVSIPPHPYLNYNKFQLENITDINPFKLLRKVLHAPRDRFLKKEILQGDIFCNERMARFRMIDSPLCTFCGDNNRVETIKHLVWDCPRSRGPWEFLKGICIQAYNRNYINYNSVVLGSDRPIDVMEQIIVLVLKIILKKNREDRIENDTIKNVIKNQYIVERMAMQKQQHKFNRRWASLGRILSLSD